MSINTILNDNAFLDYFIDEITYMQEQS